MFAANPTPTTTVQWLTLIVAVLAVVATVVAAVLLRKTGKGTVEAAQKAAVASEKSAAAAQEAVGVNRETAAGVAQRAEADALAKRYQDSASQLGHDKAAVRLAGAHSMARLAEDWPAGRQTCVDVLCAYLRMPVSDVPGELGVRRTIFTIIEDHLRVVEDDERWTRCFIDLRDAELSNVRSYGLRFLGGCDLSGAKFSGESALSAQFAGWCRMERVVVEGKFEFELSPLPDLRHLTLDHLHVVDGAECLVRFRDVPTSQVIVMEHVLVEGALEVAALRTSQPPAGAIQLSRGEVRDGATLTIRTGKFGPGQNHAPDIVAARWQVGRAKIRLQQRYVDSGRLTWRPDSVDRRATVEMIY